MAWQRAAWTLIVLAATLPYLPTLDDYFVQDDFGVVWVLHEKPWTYFPRWFHETWMHNVWGYTPDEIRPFPALTYQVAAAFGASAPWPNHVINIALHAANALLVYSVALRAACVSAVPALVAALVFAVLPMQTESVAWITGRVDSMPAGLFVAAFLLYVRWRQDGRARNYWWSVALCFAALFSKQNTVTLGPTILLFDLIVLRRRIRPTWAWLRPYVPYIALTAGYLALRFVLYGEVAREGSLNARQLEIFARDLSTHLRRMVFGEAGLLIPTPQAALWVAAAVAAVIGVGVATAREALARLAGPALFFSVAWVGLSVAPTLVAGYASPRHMYLASFGWAVLVAMAFDVVRQARPMQAMRFVSTAAVVLLLVWYASQLRDDIRLWEVRSGVSRAAATDLAREALAAPEGSLFVIDAPGRSWNFSLPYAVRPPFTGTDATARVGLVMHSSIYCCPANVWEPAMRQTLRTWLEHPARPPVIALHWDADTGALSKLSERDEPYLRPLMQLLLDTPDVATFDRRLLDIGERLVKGQR